MLEKTEIDVTVIPVVNKISVIGEVGFRGMFQNEESIAPEQVMRENQTGNFSNIIQLIRRIGKNHIKLRMATAYKFENIRFDKR